MYLNNPRITLIVPLIEHTLLRQVTFRGPLARLHLLIDLINEHLIVHLVDIAPDNALGNLQLPRLQTDDHQTIQRFNLYLGLDILHHGADLTQNLLEVVVLRLVVLVEPVEEGEYFLFDVTVGGGLLDGVEHCVYP